jgi:CcmD family protein
VKRAVCAWVLAIASVISIGAGALAQPQPPVAAQDEFVPVGDLPDAEQLPAAPLLIASYAFIWVATLAYVWFTWRRIDAAERELGRLRRELGPGPTLEP